MVRTMQMYIIFISTLIVIIDQVFVAINDLNIPERIRVGGAHTCTVSFCQGLIRQWYFKFPLHFPSYFEQSIWFAAFNHDASSTGHVFTVLLVFLEIPQYSGSSTISEPSAKLIVWKLKFKDERERGEREKGNTEKNYTCTYCYQ